MIFSLILTLGGCNSLSVFKSDSHKFLISALGFEEIDNKITLYAEALVINSEDMNSQKKRIIFEGVGDSCETALNISKSNSTENFDLSHCGIIALSNNLSEQSLNKILNWCYNTDQITLSAKLIACVNPKILLDSEPISSVATGYDILSLLEKNSEISGIRFENSLFEVIEKNESSVNVFSIPFISLDNDNKLVKGITLYKENSYLLNLDESKMFLYSLITDSFSSGNITLDNETQYIKSKKTTYKTEKTGNFIINISLKTSKNTKRTIKKDLENLIFTTQNNYGDIFGIGNIIEHQNKNLWGNIRKDFNKLKITVAIK